MGRNHHHGKGSSTGVDAAIAAAASSHGNVAWRQLIDLGLTDGGIRYRIGIGRLYPVHRGVYSVGRPAATALERADAAVLACGSAAALSHGSAMTLWGFWKRWERPLEVTVIGDRRTKGVKVHRSTTLHRRDIGIQLGIRVTSPARTIFDISPRLTDKQLKRAVNSALHTPWLTEWHLEALVTRLRHVPAARRIGPLIGLPGTPTRSGWEDDFPAFCAAHGLPPPVMGAVLNGYVRDALFPEHKVIVELDSWEFHKEKIAFETDRERDAETLAQGFVTVRITWERTQRSPRREAERLHRILAARAPKAA